MTTAQDVQRLYIAYFSRPADPVGLAYWVSQIDGPTKQSIQSVANNFALSPEYTANFTGLSSAQIVNSLYINLFGRAAEPDGLLYWAAQLTSGAQTVGKIALSIALGAIDTATTKDATALNSKISASTSFTAAVDTTPEILGYNGTAANALARTFLSNVVDAATLATAIAPTALNATISQIANIGTPGINLALTANVDVLAGTANNDTFSSTGGTTTLTALDSIDGGAGNDTLTYVQTAAIVIPTSASVKNVENASLTSGAGISGDVSGWTGLTRLTTIATGDTTLIAASTTAVTSAVATGNTSITGGSDVTVTASALANGATTAVSSAGGNVVLSATGALVGAQTLGAITVTAAGNVTVNQSTSNNTVNTTATQGTVTVTGGANTTSVSVVNAKAVTAALAVAGIGTNTVAINDVNGGSASTKAGVLTTATISGYTTVGISANSLTTLSLTNGSGNVIIDNSNSLTTVTNKTLAVTIDGLTGGTLDDADIYTTLNVTTANNNSTLANVTFGGTTALTVAGTKNLTLTSTAGLTALKTATISGAAGLTADLSGATVTGVDSSATTGTTTVTIDASKATFTGGAGVDRVTLTAAASTKAISLGDGNDSVNLAASAAPTAAISGGNGTDTLTLTAALAATASGSATFAGLVTGFESLVLTGATNQTVDLAVLGNYTSVSTAGGNGLTLSNLPSGGTLTLTGAGTAYTIGNSAFAAGTADVVNLVLTDGSGAGVSFAATGITASGVETFNITTADTQATPSGSFNDSLTLLGNSAKTITVAGNAGLTLTATDTALTSLDASGITLGGFTFTSGALASASSIKGSATGTNTIDVSASVGAVTYTGGTGIDAVTLGANTKANVLTLGNGTNTVTGSTANGANTVTGGTGTDSVTLGSGNNTVSLGNGTNSFTATSGNNTYTGGTGVDNVTLGGGVNTVTTGTGADIVTFNAVSLNGNSYSAINDAHTGLSIVFTDAGQLSGTSTFTTAGITLANTAVFQDYLDAATASAGTAANSNISWFVFGGNTYIVEDNSASTTYQNGVDTVVRLVGVFDLSDATFTATATTSTALTLA